MSEQLILRRRIAGLERIQQLRRAAVAARKAELDAILELEDRRITNLKTQLTIGAVAS